MCYSAGQISAELEINPDPFTTTENGLFGPHGEPALLAQVHESLNP